MNYAVIMAGGSGKRLWPLSRKQRPKQVLKILDGQTLLRRCYDRLIPVLDRRNIIILTNQDYAALVRENLPEVPVNNVISEPEARDTAGAIGLAATVLIKAAADPTMVVLTADQIIQPTEVLQQAITDAIEFVNKEPESLVTFGIKPTFASTQLGYLKVGKGKACGACKNLVYPLDSFKEKPTAPTAAKYVKDRHYFWNSGMFVWKAKTILKHLKEYLPESTEPLEQIRRAWDTPSQMKVLAEWFPKLPKISIDFAVMEKAKNVYALKLDCEWKDMGSFAVLADLIKSDKNKNVVVADHHELIDCKENIVVTEDKGHMIACIGLKNVVVAHTKDATLVCDANDTARLKELLAKLEEKGEDAYL